MPRVLPVLLTRPAAASAQLAARLRALGAPVVESPLLRIVYRDVLPPLAPALIFTSHNGVAAYRALGGPPRPVWCVGPRTAQAAQTAGLSVQGVAPDATALAQLLPQGAPPLLHLRGAVQRGDLASDLRARGLAAKDAVLYEQRAVPLSADGRAVLRAPAVVPLYSPRTARLFVEVCPLDVWSHLTLLSLSAAVAEALPTASKIADAPDGAAMWQLLLQVLGLSAVEGRAGSD